MTPTTSDAQEAGSAHILGAATHDERAAVTAVLASLDADRARPAIAHEGRAVSGWEHSRRALRSHPAPGPGAWARAVRG